MRVVVLSDLHSTQEHASQDARVHRDLLGDLVVLNGDLVAGAWWQERVRALQSMWPRVAVAWGNHDGDDASGSARSALHTVAAAYTYHEYHNVGVFVLDSGTARDVYDARMSWGLGYHREFRGVTAADRMLLMDEGGAGCRVVFQHIMPRQAVDYLHAGRYEPYGVWGEPILASCDHEPMVDAYALARVRHVFVGHDHCNIGSLRAVGLGGHPDIHSMGTAGYTGYRCGAQQPQAVVMDINATTCTVTTSLYNNGTYSPFPDAPGVNAEAMLDRFGQGHVICENNSAAVAWIIGITFAAAMVFAALLRVSRTCLGRGRVDEMQSDTRNADEQHVTKEDTRRVWTPVFACVSSRHMPQHHRVPMRLV
jgi:hypothetical protein